MYTPGRYNRTSGSILEDMARPKSNPKRHFDASLRCMYKRGGSERLSGKSEIAGYPWTLFTGCQSLSLRRESHDRITIAERNIRLSALLRR